MEWHCLPAAHTPAGNFKQPTRQQVIEWISQAWYEIQDEIIIKSFKKCGISNTLDESEDSEIREEIPTDFEDKIVGEEEHEEDDNEEEFDPFEN